MADVADPGQAGCASWPLGDALGRMAQGRAAPAAGSAAGWAIGIAAALTAKAARLSHRQLGDPASVLAQRADELRTHALQLADEDARVVTAMIQSPEDPPPAGAVLVPQQIQELAADVFELAERLATDGNPWLYADADAARNLSKAAYQSAATILQSNQGEPGSG